MSDVQRIIQTMILARYDQHLVQFHPQLIHHLKASGIYHSHMDQHRALLAPYVTLLLRQQWSDQRICCHLLDMLLQALGPSRYAYLDMLLRHRHPVWYGQLGPAGLLHHTILELLPYCAPLFSRFCFDAPSSVFDTLETALSAVIAQYRLAQHQ